MDPASAGMDPASDYACIVLRAHLLRFDRRAQGVNFYYFKLYKRPVEKPRLPIYGN